MNIGNTIRKLREEKNISQYKLAKLMDITAPYLSRVETQRDRASISTLVAASIALEVKPSEIIAEALNITQGQLDASIFDDLIYYLAKTDSND